MEEEESETSLVSDTVTRDTQMSETPANQEDVVVWIKNLDSHMENREQFLRGLLNPFGKVLLIQIFQDSEIVFGGTVTINFCHGSLLKLIISMTSSLMVLMTLMMTDIYLKYPIIE
jgi:hypothetical protein